MKTTQKALSILLAVLLVFTCIPMAWAAEDLLLQPAALERMRGNMDRLRRQASLEPLFLRLTGGTEARAS